MATKVKTADDRRTSELKRKEGLKKGHFTVPHCLFWLSTERLLRKSEFVLLVILLHLENKYAPGKTIKAKRGQWFFHSNEQICSYKVISEATFMEARAGLIHKGLIEFDKGHTDVSSRYRILDIEGFLPE